MQTDGAERVFRKVSRDYCLSCVGWCNNPLRQDRQPRKQCANMDEATHSYHVVAHVANTAAASITVMDKVNKWFGALHVLRDISLSVAERERVVVCGPSGSGKSTMIRCLN